MTSAPLMSAPSITCPLVVTLTSPLMTVSLVPGGTPVLPGPGSPPGLAATTMGAGGVPTFGGIRLVVGPLFDGLGGAGTGAGLAGSLAGAVLDVVAWRVAAAEAVVAAEVEVDVAELSSEAAEVAAVATALLAEFWSNRAGDPPSAS